MVANWKALKIIKLDVLPSKSGIVMVSKIHEKRQICQLIYALIPKDTKQPVKSALKKFKTIKDERNNLK